MKLTEQIYQTQYTCQCGQTNTAYLSLNNAIDDVNYGKQYFELRAECPHCYVMVGIKFDTVPFTFDERGDPYASSISQHSSFFRFDLEKAVKGYKWQIATELKRVLRLVEAPTAVEQQTPQVGE